MIQKKKKEKKRTMGKVVNSSYSRNGMYERLYFFIKYEKVLRHLPLTRGTTGRTGLRRRPSVMEKDSKSREGFDGLKGSLLILSYTVRIA